VVRLRTLVHGTGDAPQRLSREPFAPPPAISRIVRVRVTLPR